ncbi:3-oxoacyl-[acyl-carrier-protein] synthase 3 [Spirochaetia bacterium]|nr:3-oxoacyl-[acyl-carrier-protein] synthase 3 [Spirochaetia bacterium]
MTFLVYVLSFYYDNFTDFVTQGGTMAIEIISTGRAIPPRRVTNNDLAGMIDTNDEWIRSHTGIGARHLADSGMACSDLAAEAGRQALVSAIERGAVAESTVEALALTVDVIVLGTTTQDFCGCPSTACIVQDKLGAKNAAALDISAACSGFIYGLETAAGLLGVNARRKRALVIGSELLSHFIDWNDRGVCVLFGDGAGAVLVEKTAAPSEGEGRRGLLRSILAADGSGADSLIIRRGGSRNPWQAGEVVDTPPHLEMNGRAVYNFAVKAVTGTIEALLSDQRSEDRRSEDQSSEDQRSEDAGISIDDVVRIVPHQANARIVQAAAKRLGIPEEKFYLNIEEYANTSAASIPIALDELNRSGQIRRGDLIMTVGFGSGLTFGGNLIVW